MPSRVNVVIAAHNEAATIAEVVRASMAAVGEGTEVIVVDDGSTDETGSLAESAGAQVIRLRPNHGKGIALREGIRHSKRDWLVFLDNIH